MYSDVRVRIKRKNKLLLSRDSPCLQELHRLMEQQHRRTLVMWLWSGDIWCCGTSRPSTQMSRVRGDAWNYVKHGPRAA
ncbi:MAG TPA: hypothetical protein GX014_08685 [Firmicutes bacterium]|jgi:hypothetical protein|nr:hypothetical protein [Bacillota bacterium]HHT43456.1 hypothetical protein [Bacillota bacterium]